MPGEQTRNGFAGSTPTARTWDRSGNFLSAGLRSGGRNGTGRAARWVCRRWGRKARRAVSLPRKIDSA